MDIIFELRREIIRLIIIETYLVYAGYRFRVIDLLIAVVLSWFLFWFVDAMLVVLNALLGAKRRLSAD